MIPFSIQVFFFKLFQLALKWSTKLLTFRTPELFSGPGSSLQLCEHIANRTGVRNLLIVTDGMLVRVGDERFIRKWRLYFRYCQAAFAHRNIGVVQAVYVRPNRKG